MNIDDLTIGQAKQLATVFGSPTSAHPLAGKKVVAILPHGFIYFGTLHQDGQWLRLSDAANLRYWKQRDGGLPEFAQKGPESGDKIDPCPDVVFSTHVALVEYTA